jgi:hypothetical protein
MFAVKIAIPRRRPQPAISMARAVPHPAFPPFQIGLLQGAAIGGLLSSAAVLAGILRARQYAADHRRGGLYLRRRPRKESRCPRCGGFRITRCSVCSGSGICRTSVSTHSLTTHIYCPICSAKRFEQCGMCEGTGRRPPPDGSGFPVVRRSVRTAAELFFQFIERVWDATQHGEAAFLTLPRYTRRIPILKQNSTNGA